jgi:hypothetical protein
MALRMIETAGPDEVTLAEAAELLGVHPNTVRNRIRSGVYQARKVPSAVGPEIYLIKRDELALPAPPPPTPWQHYLKQAFWSDDPQIRWYQVIQHIGGAVLIALVWGFAFGRAWEMVKHERWEATPSK